MGTPLHRFYKVRLHMTNLEGMNKYPCRGGSRNSSKGGGGSGPEFFQGGGGGGLGSRSTGIFVY